MAVRAASTSRAVSYTHLDVYKRQAMWYKPEELVGKTLVAIVNLPPRKMMGLESNGMLISAVHSEHGEERLNLLMLDDKIPAGAKMC